MNGKLILNNPRLAINNHHPSALVIESIELSDEGSYQCQTDQTINYIAHLIVINCKYYFILLFSNKSYIYISLASTIHLTVLESSNVTLQCAEKGMWIIEEGHRGGPVRE
jgi:hypothetical protein